MTFRVEVYSFSNGIAYFSYTGLWLQNSQREFTVSFKLKKKKTRLKHHDSSIQTRHPSQTKFYSYGLQPHRL